MSRTIVILNSSGIEEMMKSAGMQAVLREYAGRVQSNAGEGFGTDCAVLSTRAVATVFPETKEAAKEAYTDNALLKALR